MLAAIIALAPLILELLKVILGAGSSKADKNAAIEEAKASLQEAIRRTRAAIDKAAETGGDTSDIEKIINKW